MTKHILEYSETTQRNFENYFKEIELIFKEAITEFNKLNVETKLNYQDLSKGAFIEIFSEYHQNKHLKFYKDFQYNKYIIIY